MRFGLILIIFFIARSLHSGIDIRIEKDNDILMWHISNPYITCVITPNENGRIIKLGTEEYVDSILRLPVIEKKKIFEDLPFEMFNVLPGGYEDRFLSIDNPVKGIFYEGEIIKKGDEFRGVVSSDFQGHSLKRWIGLKKDEAFLDISVLIKNTSEQNLVYTPTLFLKPGGKFYLQDKWWGYQKDSVFIGGEVTDGLKVNYEADKDASIIRLSYLFEKQATEQIRFPLFVMNCKNSSEVLYISKSIAVFLERNNKQTTFHFLSPSTIKECRLSFSYKNKSTAIYVSIYLPILSPDKGTDITIPVSVGHLPDGDTDTGTGAGQEEYIGVKLTDNDGNIIEEIKIRIEQKLKNRATGPCDFQKVGG